MAPKLFYRLLKLVMLVMACDFCSKVTSQKIGIGVVFDHNTDEIQNAFKFAMMQHTNVNTSRRIDFQAYVDIINTADAFKLSRLICNQFARGVWSMLGAVTPDSFDTLHSYTNTFQMPFVTPWFPEKVKPPSSGLIDHAVSLRPDYHRAVIDTIAYYGWKTIIYMYDSHDGLLRLQQLYQKLQPGTAVFRISHVKQVANAFEAVQYLRALERLDRWTNKYVVLDSSTQLAKDVIILHVRDVQLGRRNYHYFLSGLVMDDRWEREVTEFGAINVTGFRVLDVSRKLVKDFIDVWKKDRHTDTISAQAALMYDGVQVLIDSLSRLQKKKPEIFRAAMRRTHAHNNGSKVIDCNPTKGKVAPFEHGDKISRLIKKTEIEGLTGDIRFNEEGHRHNFTLHVVEMNVEGAMEKVATWYDDKGLVPTVAKLRFINNPGMYERNRTYVVTTILEAPYIMLRSTNYQESKLNDAYKGFCADLAEILSRKLEIKYELRLVKDGKYGNENPRVVGGWDGMIGEILKKEADMAIAPLTVTLERERAVDFSKPFLSFDLMPPKKSPKFISNSIFSFLNPLSKEVWVCIMCSLLAVTVVLFLVSRFSPCEWRLVSFTDTQTNDNNEVATTKTTIVNELSFWNSLWFSLGSFMQQGSDVVPRSASGRIVGTVWWFFTLIVVSLYTANLASHLTAERISDPIHSADKLTACSEDASDGKHGVTAAPQDMSADDQTWMSMMFEKPDEKDNKMEKKCEMMVSFGNSGIKEFAVAFPKKSSLRDGVNLALQSMKDDGEMQKLIRKWFTALDCQSYTEGSNGSELTLSQVAGIFYVLVGGLVVALVVALLEFCQHGRSEAARVNVPLRTALRAKAYLSPPKDHKSPPQRPLSREQDRLAWNGGAFTGYYSPANQIGQEETALQSNFTQV